MIQRIQTLYLLLASSALGLQFALPYAQVGTDSPAKADPVFADGVFNLIDNIGLLGLTGLGLVAGLVAIFLFKNRPLQGRIAAVGMMVSIMLAALCGFALYQAMSRQYPEGATVQYQFGMGLGMPILAIALLWLAQRAIGKDENLVRSMDRLR